jgi:hypothetical protein
MFLIKIHINPINMTELVKIIELNFCSSQTYR